MPGLLSYAVGVQRIPVLLVLLSMMAAPPSVVAHEGAEAWLHVPADHVPAGGSFEIWGNDLPPESDVTLRLAAGPQTLDLGVARSDAEGHFVKTVQMPSTIPAGYVELVVSTSEGASASTWVLVGSRSAQSGPMPDTGAEIDPSLIVLGVLLGGAVGGVGYLLLRPKRHSTTIGSPRVRVKR